MRPDDIEIFSQNLVALFKHKFGTWKSLHLAEIRFGLKSTKTRTLNTFCAGKTFTSRIRHVKRRVRDTLAMKRFGVVQIREMLIFHFRTLQIRGMATLLICLVSHVLHEALLKIVTWDKAAAVADFLLRRHLVRAGRVHAPPVGGFLPVISDFFEAHLSSGLLASYSLHVPETIFDD